MRQRRLLAARQRILAGDSMGSIAEQVGFCDYSAFYRAFKQEYGIAPRDYARLRGERKA
ncbi:MAG: helix-turn-helix domain-containing protein [Subdoligranulum sp.]|nr:helix-turn-helix domain-containing protein [Subdoligranulum sp.]MBD5102686.1 helix-turn-helix domain-containing protein [Subdoligranulum sp.]